MYYFFGLYVVVDVGMLITYRANISGENQNESVWI
jgi:hypothetical protein